MARLKKYVGVRLCGKVCGSFAMLIYRYANVIMKINVRYSRLR